MGRDVTVLRLIGMRSPKTDSGFILPVAIGVGLIMILLGIIIINRSMQNRFTAIAQKQTSQSQAAAEAGIAQLQSLFNRYPPLATYSSTNWNSLSDTVLASNFCTALPTTTEASDLVEDYANDVTDNEWKLVHTNPDEGQFRLVSYTYIPKNTSSTSPIAPRGELIVEGRVRAATARLKVQFEITHPFPGLWISSNSEAGASDSVQLKTNILDSTCSAATNTSRIANLKAHMPAITQPLPHYNYRQLPGEPFPSLPLEGFNPPLIGSGSNFYSISSIQGNQILPRTGDIVQNGVLIYKVEKVAEQSIRLSSNSTLEVGSGNETVVLYLDGGLSISDRSKIKLISGSKLIIYAHGPVTMSGDSGNPLIEQASATAASGNVQLYVYPPPSTPPTPPHNVQINGDAEIHMVLFAPQSEVTFSTSTAVKGMIWAKAWNGLQNAAITENKPNLLDLKLIPPPRISPITSWERVSSP